MYNHDTDPTITGAY